MKSFFHGLLCLFLMLGTVPAIAQIGIGTKTPAPSAALEVTSSTNNKGILIPRVTATQKNAIVSPAEGLMIFQTTAPAGFYYYTSGAWRLIISQTDLASGNAGSATKLASPRNINGVAFDGSADITIATGASAETLTGTTIKSTVTGSSLTSVGTLANLTVTNPIAGSITGNAATATTAGTASMATKLATSRNINGVGFDGSGDITITADAGTLSGTTLKSTVTGSSLTSVGTLANLTVTNPIAGSITGNATTATTAGTASTATKLATSRNINGVAFDGSGDITVNADAGTLTGTTLKSTVTGSSLTSVGILNSATVNGKVIVGASSAASASAVLEVSSTTQGFLPPRMTWSQRDAISSKVAGLVVWCSDCGNNGELQVYNGTTWTNIIGGTASLGVGMAYQGGKIAYILQVGDPGYDANTQHGLVAAVADISVAAQWGCINTSLTVGQATAIGTGNANTAAIMAACPTAGIAARLCGDLVQGGYSDWYLPSKDELYKLYLNRVAIGGFTNNDYWSSTELGLSNAWFQGFGDGLQSFSDKNYTNYVRAIRAF